MTISMAGSIGIGLVVGWLSAGRRGLRRPVASVLWLSAAFVLTALEVLLLAAHTVPAISMALSGALSACIHAAWLQELASKYPIHKEV